jgi:lipoprotein-anchoring transpeptidase ErfK/SrfK
MKKTNIFIAILFCLGPCLTIRASVAINAPNQSQQTFLDSPKQKLYVDVQAQKLHFTSSSNHIIQSYKISTGKNGTGETPGSYKTPRGIFAIRSKIGANNHPLLKYKAQIPVGIYHPAQSRYDNILSRILTLDGLQSHNKNTLSRYVYIHGTSAIKRLGTIPCSLGCIRMNPYEIVELFKNVESGTPVYIYDKTNPLPTEKNTSIILKSNQQLFVDRRHQLSITQQI